jgi:hypothetical protein
VALTLLEPGSAFNAAQWPEAPGVVGLYAVVEAPEGTYVATRFVPGARTLAELRGARAGRRRRWLDEVAATLDGVVHGRLSEDDVLIDGHGHALVTGFGRAAAGATAADDAQALARMRPPPRRRVPVLPAVAVVAAGVAGVVLLTGGDDARPAAQPPPALPGAASFGSALAPGPVRTVDCDGRPPSGSSVACTVMQSALPGRPLRTARRGFVRRWVVRGVTGPVQLQVVAPARGGMIAYNHSRTVTVRDPAATTVVHDSLSVPAGARFALELRPGSGFGVAPGDAGATTVRFFGPLRAIPQRPVRGRRHAEELLLRVDVLPKPG